MVSAGCPPKQSPAPGNGLLFSPITKSAHPCSLQPPCTGLPPSGDAYVVTGVLQVIGEEEPLVVSGIKQQWGEEHLIRGQQKIWLASPLGLKPESELISDSSQEVTFGRTFSREKQDWWISCFKNGFGLL